MHVGAEIPTKEWFTERSHGLPAKVCMLRLRARGLVQ